MVGFLKSIVGNAYRIFAAGVSNRGDCEKRRVASKEWFPLG